MKFDKKTLQHIYWKEEKSLSEIGKIYNCSGNTIKYHMKKAGIPIRSYLEGIRLKNANCHIRLSCKICGNDFFVIKSKIKQAKKAGSKIRYCSIACRTIGMQGRHLKKNEDLSGAVRITHRLRKSIGKCQICGFDEEPRILTTHHKDRNRKNNSASNLLLCCPNCHSLEHIKMGLPAKAPIIFIGSNAHDFSRYHVCWYCGKVFRVVHSNNVKFCSKECHYTWSSKFRRGKKHHSWKEKAIITCKVCGKPFEVYPCRKTYTKYCSKNCEKIGRSRLKKRWWKNKKEEASL